MRIIFFSSNSQLRPWLRLSKSEFQKESGVEVRIIFFTKSQLRLSKTEFQKEGGVEVRIICFSKSQLRPWLRLSKTEFQREGGGEMVERREVTAVRKENSLPPPPNKPVLNFRPRSVMTLF